MKSPSASTVKASPLLVSVGIKKPLSPAKKSPASTTKSTSVKKTTTTVIQKKIVNGDIVKEETTTTSGDPFELLKPELKELTNGNGLTENGAGEAVQMVLDSAAD